MDVRTVSRLMFEAREEIEMFADMVERRTGKRAEKPRRLVQEIDDFRAHQGWNLGGYGGEETRSV